MEFGDFGKRKVRLLAMADDCSPTANEEPRLAKSGPVINGGGTRTKAQPITVQLFTGVHKQTRGWWGKRERRRGRDPSHKMGHKTGSGLGLPIGIGGYLALSADRPIDR